MNARSARAAPGSRPARPAPDPDSTGPSRRRAPAGRAAAALPGSGEILQHAVEEVARLLRADGGMVYLVDEERGDLRFAHDAGITDRRRRRWVRQLRLPLGVGLFGRAVAERRVLVTDDYPNDASFRHAADPDRVVRETDIRSMVVAPMLDGDRPIGALGAFSSRTAAYGPADIALTRALAEHAAAALANRRLIDELARSELELERRADLERTLRDIWSRLATIRDPAELLQDVVHAASRLVGADGTILSVLDEPAGLLHWGYDDGIRSAFEPEFVATLTLPLGAGPTGRAMSERCVVRADDDLHGQFPPGPENDHFFERTGFRSLVCAPIVGERGPLGALEVYARRPAAFDDTDAQILGALADQAAIAMTNAGLIEELGRSREELAGRAAAERALREIAARLTAIRDPGDVVQRAVDEAARLLHGDGARVDVIDARIGLLRGVYMTGGERPSTDVWPDTPDERLEQGISGQAVERGEVVWTGDYLADDGFPHASGSDVYVRNTGIRSVIAAPLIGEGGAFGALTVYSQRADAFAEEAATLLAALADQAAIALRNARLIEELRQSREELARRVESERSLREIAARITAIADPGEVLDRVVEESRRLLASDGAHLTLASDDGAFLRPVVVAGAVDAATLDWIRGLEFPMNGGINGLAAAGNELVWTADYLADSRIPLEPDDVAVARRMELRAMAAAPLRAPGGEAIGTLAISYREPRAFERDELALLQGLADHAAIALANSRLLEQLRASEERYRHLVQNSPDIVWAIDADARFTFVSDTTEQLTGWRPDELLGRHFGALVHPSSRDVAERDWNAGQPDGAHELRGRINLLHRDGHAIPAEFIGLTRIEGGDFVGANGSVRDMTERERLERDLRESEERYRFLVENSPDVVFATDDQGRFTFMTEPIEAMTGWPAAETIGHHFSVLVDEATLPLAAARWAEIVRDPTSKAVTPLRLRHRDGRLVPVEVSAVGIVDDDGRFVGIHGATRDVTWRERLETELRASEERYRFLVEHSPDIVFATDAEGRYTYYSETVEHLTGWRPDELIGRHFSVVVDLDTFPAAAEAWQAYVERPTELQVHRFALRRRDGGRLPVEVSAVGMTDAHGRFAGIHGAARDVSDRERLERDLRRQAAELASNQERAHLARELHDSVTQALFSMTLITRSIEVLLDRDPAAARQRVAALRDLQRDALAEMRSLIFELRPGSLEQDGLVHALRTHVAGVGGRLGLPIVFDATGVERLPIAIEDGLYRIAQEALHNVVKHAAAHEVRIELGTRDDDVVLRIADDGKGFDPARVGDGHFGLDGMRSRAERLGGRLEVWSRAGSGTRIEVVVPGAAAHPAPAAADPPADEAAGQVPLAE